MSALARLYLITPVVESADQFASELEAALAAGDVACLLLRTPAHDDRTRRAIATALVPVAQSHNAAVLIEDDTRIAAGAGADGVHVTGVGDHLDQALRSMKPSRIVGVGGLASRDEAMTAGESGVDYLLLGDEWASGESSSPLDTRLERVGWWAELFQVPCVAYAHALAEVEDLAAAGAEFVALSDAVWRDARGPGAAVRDALQALEAAAARTSPAERV